MSGLDAELDRFRADVSCAVLLERLSPVWRLDKPQSTRRALKYRRGKSEVLIVCCDGRGWWDPRSSAKGDVFNLVQYLDPALNFGQVRQVLRRFVGVTPSFPEILRERQSGSSDQSVADRWARRPRLRRGSPGWTYLADVRCLPEDVLQQAAESDAVREGYRGSTWFAHRDDDAAVTHVEVRGPDFRCSLQHGAKTLFRFGQTRAGMTRLVLAEAPIDALSLAAIEGIRADTTYLATGGGMGPCTIAAIEAALCAVVASPDAVLLSATDANDPGERYAERHAAMTAEAGVRFARLRPVGGIDWNDVLKARRGTMGADRAQVPRLAAQLFPERLEPLPKRLTNDPWPCSRRAP